MQEFIQLSLLCYIASALGTISGFGTSTIMMPLVMLYYPLQDSLFFVSILHWVNGITRLFLFREGFDLKLILSFGLAGMLASFYGAHLAFQIDEAKLMDYVAYFLIAYSVFLVFSPKFKIRFKLNVGLGFGLISGFLAGLFAMGGAIRAAFLAAFDLPKAVYLANSALILVLIDSTRLFTYISEGASYSKICTTSILFLYILFSIFGVKTGELLVHRIPQTQFRYGIALMLCLLGLKLIFS